MRRFTSSGGTRTNPVDGLSTSEFVVVMLALTKASPELEAAAYRHLGETLTVYLAAVIVRSPPTGLSLIT
jgi:hypothetical protein